MDLKISTADSQGNVSLTFGKQPQRVSGIQALVQQVIIEILSDFNPYLNRGAGIKQIIETADPSRKEETRSDIRLAIASAKAHIISNQESETQILSTERLADMYPTRIESANGLEWAIDLEVFNVAGESVDTGVSL